MITVDISVIEEWYRNHKSQGTILMAVILAVLGCWLVFYGPLVEYYKNRGKAAELTEQRHEMKKWMVEKTVLKNQQQVKINRLEKEFNIGALLVSPVVLLSQHLQACSVTQYIFSDEKKASTGGQGRSLFILEMSLNYAQALCVLTHFSRKSIGWNLLNFSLGLDESNQTLTMRLGLERFLKDII